MRLLGRVFLPAACATLGLVGLELPHANNSSHMALVPLFFTTNSQQTQKISSTMPSPSPPREKSRSRSPQRPRSRSPSRRDRDADRSRSPRRKPKQPSGAFRWKDKPRREESGGDRDFRRDDRDSYVSSRYRRDRSPRRRDRDFDRDRDQRASTYRPGRDDRDDRDNPERGQRRERRHSRDRNRERGAEGKPRDEKRANDTRSPSDNTPKAPAKPAGGGEPYIIVTVNDRLGTKAQIPCLASDPVSM
jgi:hypothetical protein